MEDWTRDHALSTYNIPFWGDGYIDVDADGDVIIRPKGSEHNASVSLKALATQVRAANLGLPVLVRFADILHHRVNHLCEAFNRAAEQLAYSGRYTAVYPVKVNQQRRVIEEIVAAQPAAANGQIGLEAGSKPELIAVLAMSNPGATIVCNGYKDREFIRLALLGQQMGYKVYIVVEKLNELTYVMEESRNMGVTPRIGVRARLASIGKGNWQNTGGEKSKFGLSSVQILQVLDTLKQANALESLQLLHFHLGSQIANIRDIQTGLRECARFYGELRRQGADVKIVDVGGGLGIDYEGTRSRSACSVNYSVHEYAFHVLRTIKEECDREGIPHPNVITESGRAITAHHAVLITDVIDRESVAQPDAVKQPTADSPSVVRDLWQDLEALKDRNNRRSVIEIYHDAAHALQEAQTLFIHGVLSLDDRAQAETIYQALCLYIREHLQPEIRAHREIYDELNEKLADKLFVNFSLFQSLPDIWGIDQIFPILPLSGLNKRPTRRGVIQDITCDSDGRIDQYVDSHGIETTLPIPEPEKDQPFLLGFFLVGAYQEILGDMHNLFGDTDSVDVCLDEQGDLSLQHPISGDTVDKVLRYVNFEPEQLLRAFEDKMAASDLQEQQKQDYLQELKAGLTGYTYLEE
ncbi:biosynthetic arginine decarboxylase [Hahella sp. KA22]|uniref:biosynthetic arginine decarboxylase n=1 Tax=Hahella sp. KA22 TaxID=1628392 RepID=UPI000FDF3EB4|nr:biosynthetic arginine decarboxylase [Hahella sp. KA22]AZZ94823.1 biosynthetic arginine decarboxylase [Hahella sp. KA22]QAY58197.1 biosynthetic arginine decarboxylase [Hahella sp. KA22]